MKRHSRFTAFLMTVMLVLSMLPTTVFASEYVTLDGKLKIKGNAVTESVLSADYEKVTPEGITDDQVKFLWMRTTLEAEEKAELEETENLTRQEIGKEKTYTVTAEDIGYIIVLQITGLEEMGYTGNLTAKTDVIEAAVTDEAPEEILEENFDETIEEVLEEEIAEEVSEEVLEEEITEEVSSEVPEEDLNENSQEVLVEETDAEVFDEELMEVEMYAEDAAEEIIDEEEVWGEELFDVVVDNEADETLSEEETASTDEYLMEEILVEEGNFDENGNPVESGEEEENSSSVFSANVSVVDFGTVLEDYTSDDIEAQIVNITNNSDKERPLYVKAEHFIVTRIELAEGEDASVLAAGATATYSIIPEEGLFGKLVGEENQEGGLQLIDDIVFGEDLEDITNPNSVTVEAVIDVEPIVFIADVSVVDFGTVVDGYTSDDIEAKIVKITNKSSIERPLYVKAEHFIVTRIELAEGEDASVLAAGATATYSIIPEEGLFGKLVGEEYQDGDLELSADIVFGEDLEDITNPNSVTVEAVIDVEPIVFIADVNKVDFGTVVDGYTSDDIEAKIVKITNKSSIERKLYVKAEHFIVTRIELAEGEDASVLAAGATATYSIIPEEGLFGKLVSEENQDGGLQLSADIVFGEDLEDITNLNSIIVEAVIDVEAPLQPAEVSIAVNPSFYDFGTKQEGYESAPEALKVTIKNTGDSQITLQQPVSDLYKIGELSASVLQPKEKATFTIRPKKNMEKGQYHETIVINTDEGVSDFVEVQFTVTEKETREPKIATADQNKIVGIAADGYTTQSKITFTAVGGGMDNTNPIKGDVRYCPLNWSVFNVNSWKNSDYSASFGMGKAGTYNLSVTFARQQYDGNGWVNTGEQDTKTVSFKVAEADDSVKLTPAAEKNTNQKDAVKTGDTTVILPLIIALLVALACVIGVIVYRKKR